MSADESYALLDDALIQLRRFWVRTAPPAMATVDPGIPVEMSTVFVVDAVHRLQTVTPPGDVTVTAIAARLDVAASTASRLIDRAVTAAMVTRGTSEVDPRRVVLSLTEQGRELCTQASAFRRTYLSGVLDGWTVAEVDTLATLLDRFATGVHQHPPTASRSKGAGTG